MQSFRFVCWKEDDDWLGYLVEHPDYWTQGETLDNLQEHLKDLASGSGLRSHGASVETSPVLYHRATG